MKVLFFGALVLLGSVSQAASYVSCGSGPTLDEVPFFSTPEMQISSATDEDTDRVGSVWDLKLRGQKDWMTANSQVTASTSKSANGATVIAIRLVRNDGMSATGVTYLVTDLYSETPRLEKFAEGGFAGGSKTDEFDCISVID